MRHGQLAAPTVDQLLEPDPELYLAGGPLAPDHCDCAGVCECEVEQRPRRIQVPACDRCSQGVMDATNDHLLGICDCDCHA